MRQVFPFSWRGLTPQLFLIVVLPLTVLLLVVTFGGLSMHQDAMRDLVGERDERAVRAAASALSEQIYYRQNTIRSLAWSAGAAGSDQTLDEILQASDFLLADFEAGLAFYSPDGQLLAALGETLPWQAQLFELAPELEANLQDPDTPAALSQTHFFSAEPLMFAAAQPQENGIIAVGAFSPAFLARHTFVDLMTPGFEAEIFMVDAQNQVIFHAGKAVATGDLTRHPGVQEALAGYSGATFLDIPGAEHVIAYSPVPLSGWALVIEEPWESVTSPMLRLTENAALVLIPVIILSMLALWFGASRIVQPLRQLEARAARLGWGDYEAIQDPVGGVSEIRHLQDELAHLAQKVKAAQQGLRHYIGAMTTGQEEERRRLARELHDDTLQSLIALNQRIQLLALSLEEQKAAGGSRREVDELQGLVESTIQNLRRLTRALRPIYLEDLGLTTALEMLAREMSTAGLQVIYQQEGPARRLEASVELALYRMAQEALSNVARHAQAQQAWLKIAFTPEAVGLEIRDQGQGFTVPDSPAGFAPSGHFGLLGLHERAEMIGAKLRIHSALGQGTQIEITVPSPPPG